MTRKTALLWWSLGILTRKRYEALLEAYASLDDATAELGPRMLAALGVKEKVFPETLERLAAFDEQKLEAEMEERGVLLITSEDEHFPVLLTQIPDCPVFLSFIGDLSVLNQPCVGVVGTRRMSPYGRRVVEAFVPVFARSGIVTVSGLALGVDAAVAKDTLDAGGKTVAVLGHGLGQIHPPANRMLAQKIVQSGGLLLSEFPLHRQPDTYTFPARNRIIAGLSAATLVCEAPEDSGAIITADLALEYDREVFAVPGQIFDAQYGGCHKLIARGHARLVTTPEEMLLELGMVVPEGETTSYSARTEAEKTVYGILSAMPQTMDDLTLKTQLGAADIGTALTMMELAGAVKNIGAGQWVRR